jgi:hypothetical protein
MEMPKTLIGMFRNTSLVPKINLQPDFSENSEDLDTCVWEKPEVPM